MEKGLNNRNKNCQMVENNFIVCGMNVTEELAKYTLKHFGKVLCRNHMNQLEEMDKYQQNL